MTRTALSCLFLTLALPAAAADDWSWRFGINGWLPSVKASTSFDVPAGGNINSETDPDNYLKNLEFTFMGTLEARRGQWSFLADVVYLSIGDYKTKVTSITGPGGIVTVPIDSGSETDLKGFIGTVVGGYEVMRTTGAHTDLVAGARYARLKTRLDWHLAGPSGGLAASGSREGTKDFWDGVVGVRGKADLGGNWDLRYYADVGAGSSKLTWQAAAAIGYRFSWGDALLGYRHLAYELDKDRPISDMSFSGPQITVGFTF